MKLSQFLKEWRDRRKGLSDYHRHRKADEELLVRGRNPLREAVQALHANDPEAAASYWDEARRLTPDHVLQSTQSVWVLLTLKRLRELEDLMREGRRRWPHNPHFLAGQARLHEAREEFDDAFKCWNEIVHRFSMPLEACTRGAACLSRLGRFDEALRLIKKGIRRHPDRHEVWTSLARLSEHSGDWKTALSAWDHLGRVMGQVDGFLGGARLSEKQGDVKGATARLREGHAMHPWDAQILAALAERLEASDQLDEAAAVWKTLRLSARNKEEAFAGEARCLKKLGKLDEAEALLGQHQGRSHRSGQEMGNAA